VAKASLKGFWPTDGYFSVVWLSSLVQLTVTLQMVGWEQGRKQLAECQECA